MVPRRGVIADPRHSLAHVSKLILRELRDVTRITPRSTTFDERVERRRNADVAGCPAGPEFGAVEAIKHVPRCWKCLVTDLRANDSKYRTRQAFWGSWGTWQHGLGSMSRFMSGARLENRGRRREKRCDVRDGNSMTRMKMKLSFARKAQYAGNHDLYKYTPPYPRTFPSNNARYANQKATLSQIHMHYAHLFSRFIRASSLHHLHSCILMPFLSSSMTTPPLAAFDIASCAPPSCQ
jgi:hypothetical protein